MKWIYYFLLITALWSCQSGKYVPIETVRKDSIYITQVQRDSIYRYDSIYIRDKGDTVWVEKYKYLFVDKLCHDTLYINRTDSIHVPYFVEKEITRWHRFLINLGGCTIGVVILIVIFMIIKKG